MIGELVFEGGIKGHSVLDIGCRSGHVCIEALRRDAASATGIDLNPTAIAMAREMARAVGATPSPDYLCGDFEHWDWQDRRFDTVVCLNILHHLYDPVGAIRSMMRLAKRRIIVEFTCPGVWDLFKCTGNPLLAAGVSGPVVVLGEATIKRPMSRAFLFTGKAMEVLFNDHTEMFDPLILRHSPVRNRQVAVANRRHIGHLVVVAGPTSSGKSTLLERLKADAAMTRKLGMEEDVDWVIPANQLTPLPPGPLEGLVHQYDLLRPYHRSIKTYARDPRCDFFKVADRITVLTMMSPSDVLRRRIVDSRRKAPWRSTRLSVRHREIYECYGHPDFLRGWYAQWFEFCDRYADRIGENLLLIDGGGGSRIASGSTWQDEYAKLSGPAQGTDR
jgi:hypothetical protein